jgi:hypothetical protein
MKQLILVVILGAALLSCRSQAEIAAAKARKQAVKDSTEREQRMHLYHQVRVALPCVPDTIIRGITVYLPGDSIPCPPGGKCPPQGVRVDTLKVRDEIALAAVRDSLAHAQYLNGIKDAHILALQDNYDKQLHRANKEAETASFWRRIVLWTAGIIAGAFAIWFLVGGKLKFISKALSWLISLFR